MPLRKIAIASMLAAGLLLPGAASAGAAEGGGAGSSVADGHSADASSKVIINGRPCKVVTENSRSRSSSGRDDSSSVTAGSGSSGNCVILRSPGDGR